MQQGSGLIPDRATARRIIHVDMDAFYASVEQRDAPDLRGRPVAVGGVGPRGVVAAASYEARACGVRSAMPSGRARRLCPDLVFLPPRFEVYTAISRQIRAIFADFTPLIEPLSLDEAYLDVTDHLAGGTAVRIAQMIRARIQAETAEKGRGLTASAGVSYNKFLAKLASDMRKPDGLFVIPPEAGADFVADLPVARFHGVGPATAARMAAMGIRTGADLRRWDEVALRRAFGKAGAHYWRICRGLDDRAVQPDRIRKSIGAETTFPTDLHDLAQMAQVLARLAARVWAAAARADTAGRRVTLKARYGDFQTLTRARSLPRAVESEAELASLAGLLLQDLLPDPRGIRLLGVTLSALDTAKAGAVMQRDLFGQDAP